MLSSSVSIHSEAPDLKNAPPTQLPEELSRGGVRLKLCISQGSNPVAGLDTMMLWYWGWVVLRVVHTVAHGVI